MSLLSHTRGFFNKLGHRLYDYRLAKAERELERHRPFLLR